MVTLDEALTHLGIDYPDESTFTIVSQKLAAAIKTLHGAVGADVETLLPGDERAKELIFIYLDDLYANRGVSAKVSGAVRLSVQNMELQLQLELRQLRAKGVPSV